MPRESPDALEDLPKEAPGQVTFGQLEDEVPSMPDEPPAGLEESLLETRQRPALDGERQDQSAEEIAEIVGDDPEQQPDLVGPEAMTGEAGRMSRSSMRRSRMSLAWRRIAYLTPRRSSAS